MLEGAFHGNILCVENGRLIHKNDTLLPGLLPVPLKGKFEPNLGQWELTQDLGNVIILL